MKKDIAQDRVLKSLLGISGFTNYVDNPDLILSLIIEECILLTRARWGAIISFLITSVTATWSGVST